MIIYDLICEYKHEFEGWFQNKGDLDAQQANGLLSCPYCDSLIVEQKISAPKISKKSDSRPIESPSKESFVVGKAGGTKEEYQEFQKKLYQVHEYIEKNYRDVGNDFTEEALSIKSGEKEASNIRGTASAEQLTALLEKGVDVLPIPAKPVDKKKLN